MKFIQNDSAVSPVIGTILLVAITVVLVAVIAAVVMGMANQPEPKQVGLTVEPSLSLGATGPPITHYRTVTVTIFGGKDVNELRYLNVSVGGADGTVSAVVQSWGLVSSRLYPYEISGIVGQRLLYLPIPVPGTGSGKREYTDVPVIVTGTFSDGTTQVLYKNTMTLAPVPAGYNAATTSSSIDFHLNTNKFLFSPVLI